MSYQVYSLWTPEGGNSRICTNPRSPRDCRSPVNFAMELKGPVTISKQSGRDCRSLTLSSLWKPSWPCADCCLLQHLITSSLTYCLLLHSDDAAYLPISVSLWLAFITWASAEFFLGGGGIHLRENLPTFFSAVQCRTLCLLPHV